MNSHDEWPSEDEERHLFATLCSGVPTAREAVTVRFLPLLMHFLEWVLPHAAPDVRDTAAEDAVLDLLRHPERFDGTRARLGAYLRMAARRDFLNLLEKENRTRRGISLGSVEEPVDPRNHMRDDDELTWTHPVLVAALAALDADEQVAFELMRDGVRKTADFVARLGLGHLSDQAQATAVTRLKDRVKRRLTRALEGFR